MSSGGGGGMPSAVDRILSAGGGGGGGGSGRAGGGTARIRRSLSIGSTGSRSTCSSSNASSSTGTGGGASIGGGRMMKGMRRAAAIGGIGRGAGGVRQQQVAVGTGSKRARALQQLAAKRTGRHVRAANRGTHSSNGVATAGDTTGRYCRTNTPGGATHSAMAAVTPGVSIPAHDNTMQRLDPSSRRDKSIRVAFRIPSVGGQDRRNAATMGVLDLDVPLSAPLAASRGTNLVPVRLVALPGGSREATTDAGSATTRSLPLFFGETNQSEHPERITDRMVADIVQSNDGYDVVQSAGGTELVGGTSSSVVPMSIETINMMLLGLGCGILLQEEDDGGGICCVYQPTSIDTASLFVVQSSPHEATGVGRQRRIVADGLEQTMVKAHAATGRDEGSLRPPWEALAQQDIHSEGEDEELEEPRPLEELAPGTADRHNVRGDNAEKQADDNAAPPEPISLTELAEAYETCLGTGEPAPASIATHLLPRYLASNEAQGAAVYDVLRSEEMIPSKDKVIFEVRDGLVSGDAEQREGLVRLVSAQVMLRLALLLHGGDSYLTWYNEAFADNDSSSSKPRKKKKRKSKKSKDASTNANSTDFFNQDITALLSCVQFALPTTLTFSAFLKDVVATPFAAKLSDTVAALYDYFEFDVPSIDQDEVVNEGKDDDSFSNAKVMSADERTKGTRSKGTSFPLLEESLKSDDDPENSKDIDNANEESEAKDLDSPLFKREPVGLARKSDNPLLADGKSTYVGSHFSNKLTNMSDLFREVAVPVAPIVRNKKRPTGEDNAAAASSTSSTSSRKRLRLASTGVVNNRENAPNLPAPEKTKVVTKTAARPFAAKTAPKPVAVSTTSSTGSRYREIVKETPSRPSRKKRSASADALLSPSPFPGTPARGPQRHPAHLVAEAALAAARKKK